MDKHQPPNRFAIVFSTGPTWTSRFAHASRKAKWRFIKAKPRMTYYLFGSFLVGLIFRTSIRHVTVTSGSVVIDHTFSGTRFWAHEAFIRIYPNIINYVPLGGHLTVDWSKYEKMPKQSVLAATVGRLVMLFTLGLYQYPNCVTTVRAVLGDMGIYVPRRAWHPKKLLIWLTENGYGITPGPPPSYCDGSD